MKIKKKFFFPCHPRVGGDPGQICFDKKGHRQVEEKTAKIQNIIKNNQSISVGSERGFNITVAWVPAYARMTIFKEFIFFGVQA